MALNNWDKQHLINLGLTERQIDKIFNEAVREAAAIGVSIHEFNPDRPFSFADYPATKARIEKVIKSLQKNVEAVIINGVRSEWTLANNKNNALCDCVFGENKNKLTREQERKYYSNNSKALEAFIQRKTAGLNLSNRVWNYTNRFKSEIEMGLDLGIRNGLPAAEMARGLKQYLNEPDKLFRRVRDVHGQLRLSQAAKNYHPGTGVYRSSYKNAMRLARTENNMAYRTSDHERWQQLDFVVGIEIRLSNNHTLNDKPFTDICDDLAGKYPKDFKFVGWHPQCRCHAISILKTPEELMKDNERILNGEEPGADSVNTVKGAPENFQKWVADNKNRIEAAEQRGTLPYFLKDNNEHYDDMLINAPSVEVTNKQVISETIKYADAFGRQSKSISDEIGAYVTPVSIKSESRIIEKAINDYGGDVSRVNDIIRNTFVVEENKINDIIKEINQKFDVFRYKQQSDELGYSGHLFNVMCSDSIKAEIQINTPQMIYAKSSKAKSILGDELYNKIRNQTKLESGLGHNYYKQWRTMTKEEKLSKKGQELLRKSNDYYSAFKKVKL